MMRLSGIQGKKKEKKKDLAENENQTSTK